MDTRMSLMEIVDGYATVKHMAFQTVIGVLFALAILSVLTRAAARLVQRRGLGWDDYFLFAAAVFLAATVGMVYNMTSLIYIWMALRKDTSILMKLDPNDLQDMVAASMGKIVSFVILSWTAIFLVKASFLAFFKQLIWQVSKIQKYYWAVVIITLVSWMFLVAEPFILCTEFGINSVKCMHSDKDILYVSMTGLITALDILTDILIVSIPIILLRRSSLRLSQKLVLGTFLCLSLFVVAVALVRVSKIQDVNGVDLPWEFFWQTMEANVAVLMGSLTLFRTLLTSESIKHAEARRRAKAAGPRSQHTKVPTTLKSFAKWRLLNIKGASKLAPGDLESQGRDPSPEVSRGTFIGLRTFLWRNKNTRPAKDTQASEQTGTTLTVDDEGYAGQKDSDHSQIEKAVPADNTVPEQQVPLSIDPSLDSRNPQSVDETTISVTGSRTRQGRSDTPTAQLDEK